MEPDLHSPCIFLSWDSAFWKVPTARILGNKLSPELLTRIDHWCVAHDVACVYFLARPDDSETVRLAEANAFRFVDVRVTLQRLLSERDVLFSLRDRPSAVIRNSHAGDLDALKAIARISFHDTRFYYDPHFSPTKCDELYAIWIAKDCEVDPATVLVAEVGEQPVGFITCQSDHTSLIGTIGLIGVAPTARGLGIGQLLVEAAMKRFLDSGMRQIQVVTQGRNVRAIRLYERTAFLTLQTQLWYHRWYREEKRNFRELSG